MGPENIHNHPTDSHKAAKEKMVLNDTSQQKVMPFPF